jgi:hypothetical protein
MAELKHCFALLFCQSLGGEAKYGLPVEVSCPYFLEPALYKI